MREEDFFDDRTSRADRQKALDETIAQQKQLSAFPQTVAKLRQQAEKLAATAEVARRELERANAPNASAAQARSAAEASRQLEADRAAMTAAASEAQQAAESFAPSEKPSAKPSAQPAARALRDAMSSLAKNASSPDISAVKQDQARVLDAVAALQSGVRQSQAKAVQADPLAAAQVFATRASEALRLLPPDMAAAESLQAQTSAALREAWDQASNQAARERLEQTPAFRSLLNLDVAGAGAAADVLKLMDRTVAPEWGRLRDKPQSPAAAAAQGFVPDGYEASLRAYFNVLDQAGTTKGR